MATRQAATIRTEAGNFIATWTGITEADTGSAITVPREVEGVTIQTTGDFTTSGAVTLEGSNNGTDYATLKDPGGTDIVMTTTAIWRLESIPLFIRPRATAGSAVSMNVVLAARGH